MSESAAAGLVVKLEQFASSFNTWDELFSDAAAFAEQVGRDRLIGISHSADKGTPWWWSGTGASRAKKAVIG
jgi:hypothetical protein